MTRQVRCSLILILLITTLITLYLINIKHKIISNQLKYNGSDLMCANRFKPYYNKTISPNNNANLFKALELLYNGYENAFKLKPAVNRIQGLYRNTISNMFQILTNKSDNNTKINDLAIVDLSIGDFGLYTLVAVSLGHQVVAVSSNFCSLEILNQSIYNISNTLNNSTPFEKITLLYNEISQHSCNKISNVNKNCYSKNLATQLTSIRFSDIVYLNKIKKFILTLDLQLQENSIIFDNLKHIIIQKYEIPTIILLNWNKVNESIQNKIIRILRSLCYSPHISPTISAKIVDGYQWPNEIYWFSIPFCNIQSLFKIQYMTNLHKILSNQNNCLEWYPQNSDMELIIEQTHFFKSKLVYKQGIVPIYIYDPKVDKAISGCVYTKNHWEPNILDQILNAIYERPDLHFIDIGANIGTLALPIAVFSKRKVIAIDANTQNLIRLLKSAKLNKLNSLYLFKNAITQISCYPMQISEIDEHNIGRWPVVLVNNSQNVTNIIKSKLISATLDNLVPMLASLEIKQAVLKIDIEGSEYSAFHSALQFFKIIDVPYVFMEWASYGDHLIESKDEILIPSDKSSEKFKQQKYIKDFFNNLGYKAFAEKNSNKPFKDDEQRTFNIVYKKMF